MSSQNVIVYISDTGSEVDDLQELVNGDVPELEWVGLLNGAEVPIRVRLSEEPDDE